MKINIYSKEENKRGDCQNYLIQDLLQNIALMDIQINDAEAKEIVVYNSIEYIPGPSINTFIAAILKKIRKGGHMIISGIDAYMVCKDYSQYKIKTDELLLYLFGEDAQKKSCIKMSDLVSNVLGIAGEMNIQCKVIKKRIEGYEYVLELERI